MKRLRNFLQMVCVPACIFVYLFGTAVLIRSVLCKPLHFYNTHFQHLCSAVHSPTLPPPPTAEKMLVFRSKLHWQTLQLWTLTFFVQFLIEATLDPWAMHPHFWMLNDVLRSTPQQEQHWPTLDVG